MTMHNIQGERYVAAEEKTTYIKLTLLHLSNSCNNLYMFFHAKL